jgi:DNA mismatch endonuclease (patch repair protein)
MINSLEPVTVVDTVAPDIRSRMMSAVRNRNTKPELEVRRALYAAGFRYRLHRRDLPGCPDIVLPRLKLAVFVHGCFWHGHDCKKGRRPTSNAKFWVKKLNSNKVRDRRNQLTLKAMGWDVFIIWECSLSSGIQKVIRAMNEIDLNSRQ